MCGIFCVIQKIGETSCECVSKLFSYTEAHSYFKTDVFSMNNAHVLANN